MSLEAQAAMRTTQLYTAPENPSQNPEIAAMLAGFSLLDQPAAQPTQPFEPALSPALSPANPQGDSLNMQQPSPIEQAMLTMQQLAQNDAGQTAALGITEAIMGGLAGVGSGFAGSDTPAPLSSDGAYDSNSSDGCSVSPTSSGDSQDSSYQPSWMQRFMNAAI
jgi:hypothetical protein